MGEANQGGHEGERLGRRSLFRLACLEACRDGRIESPEGSLLQKLQQLLGIPPEMAHQILDGARAYCRTHPAPESGGLDPESLFGLACQLAWADGTLEDRERKILEALARLLELSPQVAAALLDSHAPEPHPSPAPEAGVDDDLDALVETEDLRVPELATPDPETGPALPPGAVTHHAPVAPAPPGPVPGPARTISRPAPAAPVEPVAQAPRAPLAAFPPPGRALPKPPSLDDQVDPGKSGLLGWFARALPLGGGDDLVAKERRLANSGLNLLYEVLHGLQRAPGEPARVLLHDAGLAETYRMDLASKHSRLGEAVRSRKWVGYEPLGIRAARDALRFADPEDADAMLRARLSAQAALVLSFYVSEPIYERLQPQYAYFVDLVVRFTDDRPWMIPPFVRKLLGAIAEDLRDVNLKSLGLLLKETLERADRSAAAPAPATPT